METTDRLINLLDEAQRAIDVLAGYAAAYGRIDAAHEATGIAMRLRAGMRAARVEEHPGPNPPGYPGPCPEGMDWSAWLAMNNVD